MQNRRYYLHHMLRRIGYNYNPKEKTVFVPYSERDYVAKQAIELRDKFHYSLQLIID